MTSPHDPDERPEELAEFDALPAPDQWSEIISRAERTPAVDASRRRRGAVLLVAAVSALVLVGALVVVAQTRSDDDAVTTATLPEPAPSTTTDEPESTTPGVDAPPVSGEPDSGSAPSEGFWSPTCVEQVGAGEEPAPDDVLLENLGPIGPEPALDISVPTVLPDGDDSSRPSPLPFSSVTRIPGGLLVSTSAQIGEPGAWILTAIDLDGSVRWRRCSPVDTPTWAPGLVTPYDTEPDRILAGPSSTIAPSVGEWYTIDLTTGQDLAAPTEIQDTAVLGAPSPGSHHVLLGDTLGEQLIDTSTDQMILVDLLTFETIDVPYPADADGLPASRFGWAVVDEGGPVILQLDFTSRGEILGRYEGLEWREPATPVGGSVEQIGFADDGDGFRLEGRDDVAELVWERGDLTNPGGAPVSASVDGLPGPTAVRVCVKRGNAGCREEQLVGVDNDTGETLWTQQPADVVVAGEDATIVAADEQVRLIDNATGELVDDTQQWSADEFFGVRLDAVTQLDPRVWTLGGIVVVTSDESIRVWYPAAMSDGTVQVGLAGGG